MLKTISFGILHYTVAFTVVFVISGDILASTLVGAIEPAVNTVVFHFHEIVWTRHGRTLRRLGTRAASTLRPAFQIEHAR